MWGRGTMAPPGAWLGNIRWAGRSSALAAKALLRRRRRALTLPLSPALPPGGLPGPLLHLPQRRLPQPVARKLGHHGARGALRRHPVQRARGVQAPTGQLLRLPRRVSPPPRPPNRKKPLSALLHHPVLLPPTCSPCQNFSCLSSLPSEPKSQDGH